jgi:diguanylate cyclase (GGDEF)-like protein
MNSLNQKTSEEPTSVKLTITILCALAGLVIFWADFSYPQLISSGTSYIVLLAVSLIARSRLSLWLLCLLFAGLLIGGYFFGNSQAYLLPILGAESNSMISMRNQETEYTMILMRLVGVLAILSTAIVGTMFLRKSRLVEDYLRNLSITDYLTGVYSRRFLFETLKQRFSDVRRNASNNFSTIIIDIDFFRLVNEKYSHLGGDLALRMLCDCVRGVIRDVDMIGRYGGEEFLVVLPNTGIDGAMLLAERLRVAAEKMEVAFEGKRIPITISLGVTDYRTFNYQHLEEMLKSADEALYRAKNNGRNQVQKALEEDRHSQRDINTKDH